MAEPSPPPEAARPQVFISYSRTDRRRATGLAVLSEALGHHVFIDYQSIPGGRRWRDALEEGLQTADVLLVFWTRYAARSKWVRREYERFDTRFPDRPLVPVLGDRTPLPDRLQARQSSDLSPPIKPLIKDLSDTVRTMKASGASMHQIQAAVLQRLEAEGITLRRDQRARLFGLFGIFGLVMVPLYFLVDQRDRLVDQTFALTATLSALPPAYYYTAGVAITAGFLTCHGAARGLDTIAYKKGHEAAQVAALSQRQAAIDAEVAKYRAALDAEVAKYRAALDAEAAKYRTTLDAEVENRVKQEVAEAQRQLRDTEEERLRGLYRQLAPDHSPKEYRDTRGTVVRLPLGDLSFADRVVDFKVGNPSAQRPEFSDPKLALGPPNYVRRQSPDFTTLGCGGTLVLELVDNVLVNRSGPDLHIFEIGPAVEPTQLAISEDGQRWIEIGKIAGGTASIDIEKFVRPGAVFRFVRLTDLKTDCGEPTPGADIDAVAAVGNPCRRDTGSMTLLLPWERSFLALVHNRSEAEFESVDSIIGQFFPPFLMSVPMLRAFVETAFKDENTKAITIGTTVWFREPQDTTIEKDLALLAHEMVHVLDYKAATPKVSETVGPGEAEIRGKAAFLKRYPEETIVAGFKYGDIYDEIRAKRVESAVKKLLSQFPQLANVIRSCDNDAILAELKSRGGVYRVALNEFLSQ